MVKWISLTEVETGQCFVKTHSLPFYGSWDFICENVSSYFECDPDDLTASQMEEGREYVLLNGEKIAEIHHYYIGG